MGVKCIDRTASSIKEVKTEIQKEVQLLDYDKFSGTIGLAADKPIGSSIPHHTTFPVNPEEGNWVRVVSETTIDGRALLIGQEWYCVTAKTEGKDAVWELSQQGEKLAVYPTIATRIGSLRRSLSSTTEVIRNNVNNFFPTFSTPVCTGVFDTAAIRSSPTRLTNLGDLIAKRIRLDIAVRFDFSSENAGMRYANLGLYTYYPEGGNLYSLLLEDFIVESDFGSPGEPLKLYRQNVLLPITEPLDENPITYGLALQARQTSGIDLTGIYGEINIVAWG